MVEPVSPWSARTKEPTAGPTICSCYSVATTTFKNPKQVVAFVCLTLNPYQFGVAGKARLPKFGDLSIRKVLYMPALGL